MQLLYMLNSSSVAMVCSVYDSDASLCHPVGLLLLFLRHFVDLIFVADSHFIISFVGIFVCVAVCVFL